MPEQTGINVDRLSALASAILGAAGVPKPDARIVAESLVDADLRGIRSHGVSRLRIYVERLRAGGNRPAGELVLVSDAPSLAVLDANDILAQVASARAVELAAEKARVAGCGVVCVRGASHFGAAGYWARLLAEQGMLGMASTNTTPINGRLWRIDDGDRLESVGDGLPLGWERSGGGRHGHRRDDLGRSAPRRGRGDPDPGDLGIGPRRPADDFRRRGGRRWPPASVRPTQGLRARRRRRAPTGALAGANCLSQIAHMYMEPEKPMGAGLFFLAADPNSISPDHARRFAEQVHDVQRNLNALPHRDGDGRVLWPGQLEAERAERGHSDGVPLPAGIAEDLCALARELDLAEGLVAALGERAVH